MATSNPKTTHTPATRIRDLTAIESHIPLALSSASSAIRALTDTSPIPSSTPSDPREAFEHHTKALYAHIQAISALLHRQAYALEEAGIISASATSDIDLQPPPPPPSAVGTALGAGIGGRPGQTGQGRQQEGKQMKITNGGMGNLDVGWLNARSGGVGKRKEVELWQQVRERVGKVVPKREGMKEEDVNDDEVEGWQTVVGEDITIDGEGTMQEDVDNGFVYVDESHLPVKHEGRVGDGMDVDD